MNKTLFGALVAAGLVFGGCQREQDKVMQERYEQEGTGGAAEQGRDVERQQTREQEAEEQDRQLQQHQQLEQEKQAD